MQALFVYVTLVNFENRISIMMATYLNKDIM